MRERREPTYRRLRWRMVLVLSTFGLVPLAAVLVAALGAEQRAIETRETGVLEAMMKNRKATIDLFLDQKMRQLELLSVSLRAADLVRPGVLQSLSQEMQRDGGGVVDLGLIDQDGRHLAYVGPYDLTGRNYAGQPWLREVMVRGRYQSDLFMGFRQFPHFIIAVKKREGDHDYFLRATLDTDRLTTLVREGAIESGANVFVLNRAGEYQTHYSEGHHLMEKADSPVPPLHSGVRMSVSGSGNHRELIATAWLKGDTWVLVAREPFPTLAAVAWQSPVARIALGALALVPLFGYLVARRGLRRVRMIEEERARLHESVAQSEKLAAIGRLAATTAHEINNPLAIIAAQVGLLQDVVRDTSFLSEYPELRDRLGKIAAQVERGKTVTHRLLNFARRVGPAFEPVDVVAALDETVSFLDKQAEAANIAIVRDYAPDVPLVSSNLGQMQQVFLNVVNNAIDAVGEKGEIRMQIRRARGGVEVVVADSGPGIQEANLERVFEPFYSTKGGEARHCGLGLAICRETMRSLGARISATASPLGGAAFVMWFPVQAGSQ
jgi:two-component system NtrC family sensor kinase